MPVELLSQLDYVSREPFALLDRGLQLKPLVDGLLVFFSQADLLTSDLFLTLREKKVYCLYLIETLENNLGVAKLVILPFVLKGVHFKSSTGFFFGALELFEGKGSLARGHKPDSCVSFDEVY